MNLNNVHHWDKLTFGQDHGHRPAVTHILAEATRSDGYRFYLTVREGEPRVYAGCRKGYTLAEYRKHVKSYRYRDGWKRRETLAILDLFANVVRRAK